MALLQWIFAIRYYSVASLLQNVIATRHYCYNASLQHCIIATLHHCYITSLLHYIIVTLHHCYKASLLQGIIATLHHYIASLHCIIVIMHHYYKALLLQGIIVTRFHCYNAWLVQVMKRHYYCNASFCTQQWDSWFWEHSVLCTRNYFVLKLTWYFLSFVRCNFKRLLITQVTVCCYRRNPGRQKQCVCFPLLYFWLVVIKLTMTWAKLPPAK